jgi:NADH-quinone oxidoreductase E subunit
MQEAAEYQSVFVGAAKEKLDDIMSRYPTKRAALLPALWIVQEERNWIPEDAMIEIAELLDVTPAQVKGVATFYTMYHKHPVGENFIQVCTTSPCNVCGAEKVVEALLKETGCDELGATSPDGKFTITEVECLGACGFATPIMVNEDFLESVTVENAAEVVARYRDGKAAD